MANTIDQIRYTLLNGIVVGDTIDLLQFILQQVGTGYTGGNNIEITAEKVINAKDVVTTNTVQTIRAAKDFDTRPTIYGFDVVCTDDITNMVTTDTTQTITGSKNFTGTLQKGGVNVATATDLALKQDKLPDAVINRYLHVNGSTGNLEWTDISNQYVTLATDQSITSNKDFAITPTIDGVDIATVEDIPSLTNYVTLDTEQSITGKKKFQSITAADIDGDNTMGEFSIANGSEKGGKLALCGNGDAHQGAFRLIARTVNTSKELFGNPSGTLTWDGNTVLTSSNGLQLSGGTMTGSLNINGNDLNITFKADSTHRGDIYFYDTTNSIQNACLRVGNSGPLQLARRATDGSAWYNGGQVKLNQNGTVEITASDSSGSADGAASLTLNGDDEGLTTTDKGRFVLATKKYTSGSSTINNRLVGTTAGLSWVVGSNWYNVVYDKIDNVSSQFTRSSSASAGLFYAYKQGRLISLTMEGIASTSSGNVTIGTAPTGYRPAFTTYGILSTTSGTHCLVGIYSNGQITMFAYPGSSQLVYGTITYFQQN